MRTIKYKITMLSDWHIGSGLDAGGDADAVVLKDENGLPYIPGKTIKGLLKDAANEMLSVKKAYKQIIDTLFGGVNADKSTFSGNASFKNAVITEIEKKEIVKNGLQEYLYKNVASTTIEEKTGVAKKTSLRTMEVTIPVDLEGEIFLEVKDNEAEVIDLLGKSFKWVRYLGVNRNRGLGRCRFEIIEKN
jgi:CRISPR/Cas system CSM-associated protein Csm3 (group 7 of RAMP superfamily)